MAVKNILSRIHLPKKLASLIAIILVFVLLLVFIWLWYDLKLRTLNKQLEAPVSGEPIKL